MKTPSTPLPKDASEVPFDKIAADIKASNEKRPVGRPKGSTTKKAESETAVSLEPQLPPQLKVSGIPHQALLNTLQIPFAVAASQTGCELLALKKEEADPLVPMLDHCIVQYLPYLLDEHAVAYTLAAATVGLAATKYFAYLDWKKAKAESVKATS